MHRNNNTTSGLDNPPRGYSLLEVLIVLAILAAMSVMVLPSMRGPLDKSRLRSAGRHVQAALGKARALAIREGNALEFRYQINGRNWKIERKALAPLNDHYSSKEAITPAGLQVNSSEILEAHEPRESISVLHKGELPSGVTFGELSTSEDSIALIDSSLETNSLDPSLIEQANWSRPTTFHPNGRSQDVSFLIRGNRDFVVEVTLRGLTSSVRYTPPFRRKPSVSKTLERGNN